MNTLFFALIEPSKSNSEYYIYYAAALTIMFAVLITIVLYILLKKVRQETRADEKIEDTVFAEHGFSHEHFKNVEAGVIPTLIEIINENLELLEPITASGEPRRAPEESYLNMLKRKFYVIMNHFENFHLPPSRAFREFLFIRLELEKMREVGIS